MKIARIDSTKYPPTRRGNNAEAWNVDLKSPEVVAPQKGRPHSSIVSWVIHAPWAHIMWANYWLVVSHLRPLPGLPPAIITVPGATHEVCLFALSPDKAPNLYDPYSSILRPVNFVTQFAPGSDEAAAAKAEEAVIEVMRGLLNPDTDFRSQWFNFFHTPTT